MNTAITPLLVRSSIKGIEARDGLERFGNQLCSSLGLKPVSIVWKAGMSTAAIDNGGTVYLADIGDADEVRRETLARYAGFLVHELLHRKYTDFSVNDHRAYVRKLHNAVEDAWIERSGIKAGLTGNIQGLLESLIGQMVDEAIVAVKDWADPHQLPFSLAVFARGYGVTVPVPAEILPIWKEAARRIDSCVNTKDTLAVAVWVFEQIQKAQPPKDQGKDQKPEGKPQAEDEGDAQGEAQGEAQEDAQEEGQGDAQGEGEGEGEGEGKGQGNTPGNGTEPADAGPMKRKPGAHDEAMEVEPSLTASNGAPGYGTYTREQVLTKKKPSEASKEFWGVDATVPARLRHEVRKMFENTASEWREGGFKSGSLHRPALVKVQAGSADVFARRFSEDGIDSAVCILLDVSGSMYHGGDERIWEAPSQREDVLGSKIYTAVGACGALMDTLAQARVDTMVMTFGSRTSLMKTWAQPWKQALTSLRKALPQGDTNDFAATRFATEALMAHHAERKVLIAITDGEGEVLRTRGQVQAAKALGIRVIGIGVGVKRTTVQATWGTESVAIKSVADLGTVAFSSLKEAA